MARSSASQPQPPRLDPEIVADSSRLAAAVDDLVLREPELRAMSRKIVRLQARLRRLVGAEAWSAYLDLEAASTARLAEATVRVARWAFEQGYRAKHTARSKP